MSSNGRRKLASGAAYGIGKPLLGGSKKSPRFGVGIGTAIGSDQPAASGADVRLPLDDDPKGGKEAGHQADYDCGL